MTFCAASQAINEDLRVAKLAGQLAEVLRNLTRVRNYSQSPPRRTLCQHPVCWDRHALPQKHINCAQCPSQTSSHTLEKVLTSG